MLSKMFKPDLSASSMEAALSPLGDHLSCPLCQTSLRDRIKQLVIQWSVVKVCIIWEVWRVGLPWYLWSPPPTHKPQTLTHFPSLLEYYLSSPDTSTRGFWISAWDLVFYSYFLQHTLAPHHSNLSYPTTLSSSFLPCFHFTSIGDSIQVCPPC